MTGHSPLIMKNGEIELLRFVFAIIVFLSHVSVLPHGGVAVDFFFILTGCLTMSTIVKKSNSGHPPLSCFDFIRHKISIFYVEAVVAAFLSIMVYILAHSSPDILHKSIITLTNNILLIKMTGILPYPSDYNGATWFLSSMIIGLLIVYPLLSHYGTHPLLLSLGIGISGYLCTAHTRLTGVYDWICFTYEGNLRAIGGLLLGAFAYSSAMKLRAYSLPRIIRTCLSFFLMASLMGVIFISYLPHTKFHGYSLCANFAIVTLAFSEQSITHKTFCCKPALILGSLSLPLYLSHRAISICYPALVPSQISNSCKIVLCLILSLFAALAVQRISSSIRMHGSGLINRIKRDNGWGGGSVNIFSASV